MWPTTVIESEVTRKMGAPPAVMRTAHVFADACLALSELTPADIPQVEWQAPCVRVILVLTVLVDHNRGKHCSTKTSCAPKGGTTKIL